MSNNNPLKIFHPIHTNGLKRLGGNYDGGYIIHYPSLADADCLVNYGVGYNVNFEKDFSKETGVPVLAFDPTLKDISAVFRELKGGLVPFLRHAKNYAVWLFKAGTLKKHNITMVEEGIADKNSGPYKTLAYHLNKHGLTGKKIILKMDVEGAEYPFFNDKSIYPLLNNALQIILELHYVEKNMDNLLNIMQNVSKTHSLIHIHSNNHSGTYNYNGKKIPETLEATFLHNKYLPVKTYATTPYPVPGLDQPCDRLQEDIVLDFFY